MVNDSINRYEVRERARMAKMAARRRYPEPVAAILEQEIADYMEFGFRFMQPDTNPSGCKTLRLIDFLLLPVESGAA